MTFSLKPWASSRCCFHGTECICSCASFIRCAECKCIDWCPVLPIRAWGFTVHRVNVVCRLVCNRSRMCNSCQVAIYISQYWSVCWFTRGVWDYYKEKECEAIISGVRLSLFMIRCDMYSRSKNKQLVTICVRQRYYCL